MRIAHLTDLHLRHHLPGSSPIPARLSRQAPDLLRLALRQAAERDCDIVVITGDLVDLPDSYLSEEAPPVDTWPWLLARKDYELIIEALDESGLPWLVIPGNHDSLWLLDEVLAGRPRVVEVGGVRFVGFWDEEDEQHVPWRRGGEAALFEAMLSPGGLAEVGALAEVGEAELVQVHLQHYLITPELNEGYPHTYGEGVALRDAIVASGRVALALSGHYHPGWEPERFGPSTFAVTAALCEAPHRWRTFDVDSTGSATDGWSVSWSDHTVLLTGAGDDGNRR